MRDFIIIASCRGRFRMVFPELEGEHFGLLMFPNMMASNWLTYSHRKEPFARVKICFIHKPYPPTWRWAQLFADLFEPTNPVHNAGLNKGDDCDSSRFLILDVIVSLSQANQYIDPAKRC